MDKEKLNEDAQYYLNFWEKNVGDEKKVIDREVAYMIFLMGAKYAQEKNG